jgi:tetratricopeptide (TPR) repeat protein
MTIVKHIKALIQEADIYSSQGLYVEAKTKYENAAGLFQKNKQLKNSNSLLNAILKKISALEDKIKMLDGGGKQHEISPNAQNLIKQLFSFSSDEHKETAGLEGAIALAKFGQLERALKEFSDLLQHDAVRVVAAKNVLRCHISLSSFDTAVAQFQKWLISDLFNSSALKRIRLFLQDLLDKKELKITLPEIRGGSAGSTHSRRQIDSDDDVLDISSIGITFHSGPRKGSMVEYDVSFQSGNMISLIISSKDKDWVDSLSIDHKLENVQYYSPIAMFTGSGIISSKTEIKSGPKKGDYCLDIRIVSM